VPDALDHAAAAPAAGNVRVLPVPVRHPVPREQPMRAMHGL
jgi:hypothetical protein